MRGDLEGYKPKLSERFIIKDRGILGVDGLHEIRILNRVITCHPAKPGCLEMLTYEADQRHADLLMAAYGLTASSKTKATLWDKAAFLARHPLAGPFLDEKRRVEFCSNCMRCLYLALDRPDIQFTAKEISRAMASPTIHVDGTLKALSRYLAGPSSRAVAIPTARMDWKSLEVDRLELGSLPGDSQELIGNLPHAWKASYHRGQLNADDFKLVKRGSGVLRSCAVCLSNAGVEESHVGFVTGGQGVARRKFGTSTVLHCGFNTPWHDDRLRLLGVREKT